MSDILTFQTKYYKKNEKGVFRIEKGPKVWATSPEDLIFILALTGQKYFRLTLYNEDKTESVLVLKDFQLN